MGISTQNPESRYFWCKFPTYDSQAVRFYFQYFFDHCHNEFNYSNSYDPIIIKEVLGGRIDTLEFPTSDGGKLRFHWEEYRYGLYIAVCYHRPETLCITIEDEWKLGYKEPKQ